MAACYMAVAVYSIKDFVPCSEKLVGQRKHMNIKGWILLLALGGVIPMSIFGQTPPPNDNYSNSIVISGTDVTFSGTLAGATIENFREESYYEDWFGYGATGSVWWNWTA